MSKRKCNDKDFEYLCKKLRKIEEKISREKSHRHRKRIVSSSSDASQDSTSSADKLLETSDERPTSTPALTANIADTPAPSAKPNEILPVASSSVLASIDAAAEPIDEETVTLDTEILEILGVDPTDTKKYGKNIQKDLAVRLEHGTTEGLSKENRKELVDTYLVPSNCKLLGAPVLNAELKAALTETVVKRDKAIESKQKVMSAALSSLAHAITLVLSSKEKDTNLLRILMDTGRLLCDCQHSDTLTRRNYVISSIKKEMKEPLQNAKVDSFLFSENLSETLKAAKAINKSGAELKINLTSKPSTSKKFTAVTAKNWRSNPPRKSATAAESTSTATTTSSTKSQRANSYKQSSQSRRSNRGRR